MDVFDEIQKSALDVRVKDVRQAQTNAAVMQSINTNAVTPSPEPRSNVFVEIDDRARNVTLEDRAQAEVGTQVFVDINDHATQPSEAPDIDVYREINEDALDVNLADTAYIDTGKELFADINESATADAAPRSSIFAEISDYVDGDVSVKANSESGLPPVAMGQGAPQVPRQRLSSAGFVSQAPKPARRPAGGRHPFFSQSESRRR